MNYFRAPFARYLEVVLSGDYREPGGCQVTFYPDWLAYFRVKLSFKRERGEERFLVSFPPSHYLKLINTDMQNLVKERLHNPI